jgi:hypothetical protein
MLVSVEDYTRREVVVGEYGGQIASFEWVFSPRGLEHLLSDTPRLVAE